MLSQSLEILRHLELSLSTNSLEEIIELYNVQQFIDTQLFRLDFSEEDKAFFSKSNSSKIKSCIGKFLSNVNLPNLLSSPLDLDSHYLNNLLEILQHYKIYKKISEKDFNLFLDVNHLPILYILQYKELVKCYDSLCKDILLNDCNAAELLIKHYYSAEPNVRYYLPESLTIEDKENIIINYINSERPNINTLEIIVSLPIIGELKISDETRLKAKEKHDLLSKKLFDTNGSSPLMTEISVGISHTQKEEVITSYNDNLMKVSISGNWLDNNKDFATLLNNFIYLLGVVDIEFRCSFVSKPNQLSIFETISASRHLKNIYLKGVSFDMINYLANIEMIAYCSYLEESLKIRIEDVLQWFFDDYLMQEFGVNGFIINMPSSGSTYLEKCRSLCSEMESLLKQFNVFVAEGNVNHDLIEISSKPVEFGNIKSLLQRKYAYANTGKCSPIMYWMFSDQTLLTYLPNRTFKCDYENLYLLLMHENINIEDYEEHQKRDIRMLTENNLIVIDDNGYIKLKNNVEMTILYDIYENGFITHHLFKDRNLDQAIKSLEENGYITVNSSLLSNQECEYFDF